MPGTCAKPNSSVQFFQIEQKLKDGDLGGFIKLIEKENFDPSISDAMGNNALFLLIEQYNTYKPKVEKTIEKELQAEDLAPTETLDSQVSYAIDVLYERGVDFKKKNLMLLSAIDLTLIHGMTAFVNSILDFIVEPSIEYEEQLKTKKDIIFKSISYLLPARVQISQLPAFLQTVDDLGLLQEFLEPDFKFNLLHYAVSYGCLDSVEYLVENKVNMNLESSKKQTPLDLALAHTNKDIAHYLILCKLANNLHIDEIEYSGAAFDIEVKRIFSRIIHHITEKQADRAIELLRNSFVNTLSQSLIKKVHAKLLKFAHSKKINEYVKQFINSYGINTDDLIINLELARKYNNNSILKFLFEQSEFKSLPIYKQLYYAGHCNRIKIVSNFFASKKWKEFKTDTKLRILNSIEVSNVSFSLLIEKELLAIEEQSNLQS